MSQSNQRMHNQRDKEKRLHTRMRRLAIVLGKTYGIWRIPATIPTATDNNPVNGALSEPCLAKAWAISWLSTAAKASSVVAILKIPELTKILPPYWAIECPDGW